MVAGGACDASQAHDATAWVNLDETDQITLDSVRSILGDVLRFLLPVCRMLERRRFVSDRVRGQIDRDAINRLARLRLGSDEINGQYTTGHGY